MSLHTLQKAVVRYAFLNKLIIYLFHPFLKRLKASLTEHQPQLYQVLEEGKKLFLSVGCSDLENQLTQLGEHWLSSTTKVNKELHRLDSTLKHWTR